MAVFLLRGLISAGRIACMLRRDLISHNQCFLMEGACLGEIQTRLSVLKHAKKLYEPQPILKSTQFFSCGVFQDLFLLLLPILYFLIVKILETVVEIS